MLRCLFVLVPGWVVLLILFRCLIPFGQLSFHLRLGCCLISNGVSLGEIVVCDYFQYFFLLIYLIYLGLYRLQSAHII